MNGTDMSTRPAPWLKSLRTKITLAMGVVAALVVAAVLFAGNHFRRKELLVEFQTHVRGVAGTTALALAGSDLSRIRANTDAASPEFHRIRAILEHARRINGLTEREIYILRPLNTEGETEFVVMLHAKPFIGDRYTIREENRPHLLRAWTTGDPASTGIYTDEHGQWISGYAPLLDAAGKPAAIVEVDAEIGRIVAEQQRVLWLSLAIGAGALCFGAIPGILLARGITRGLNQLADGMRRFQSGDHAVHIDAATGDEIEQLSHAFNEMIVSLREKLALLPYVSRFTAEAVQRSRTDPSWLTGSEQEVLVLFADLRGFTSFSEQREAAVLVRELNQLLSVQADVVISAGGDVDKFIGDAVMAVFIDQADTAEQVYRCAQQLIRRLQEEVARNGWPLGLGVGVHRGRAVVGSIGSETRRDLTAIGHTVNFAARLCERAGPWQILVSESFFRALPDRCQREFVCTEPMQFKNLRQVVPTYCCSVPAESAPSAELRKV